MDDELKGRLQRVARGVPDGKPDVASVRQQGQRERVRRRGLIALSTAACVALAGVGLAAVVGRDPGAPRQEAADHTGDGVFVPAERGEATYLLSDFKIYYPYARVDHMPGMAAGSAKRQQLCSLSPARCQKRWDQAGVSYEWRWATNSYPGDLDCRLRLYDNNGDLVANAITGLSGLESRSRGKPFVIPIDVSGEPVRAEGECEAGQYEGGAGWRITFVRSEPYQPDSGPPGERLRLIFEVEELDDHADSRACRMKVWFESGRTRSGEFTTNSATIFESMETQYPASDPVTDAKVTCGPIKREKRESNGRGDLVARPQCSWQEDIAPWLKQIVVNVGAPEGRAVKPGQVRDTEGGVQIILKNFEPRGIDIFVTADSEPDAENRNTTGMSVVASPPRFQLFRKRLEHSDVLIAQHRTSPWTISLAVYSDQKVLKWKDDQAPELWMSAAIDEANERGFPSCK